MKVVYGVVIYGERDFSSFEIYSCEPECDVCLLYQAPEGFNWRLCSGFTIFLFGFPI